MPRNSVRFLALVVLLAGGLAMPIHSLGKGLGGMVAKGAGSAVGESVGRSAANAVIPPPSSRPESTGKPQSADKPSFKQASSVRLPPTIPTVQFDFSAKKDPFKPFVLLKAVPVRSAEDEKKSLLASLPIHSLDVSQFKLIGIMTGVTENRAMVVDTGGKGYVIRVGMSIGKNNGKVVSISNSGVEVVQQFKDEKGRVRKENIKLTLPRKQ